MRGGNLETSLWTQARALFEVRVPGGRSPREIWLRRPFGLVGRIVGADIPIADTGVSARHAYLHMDDRGVCLIDLASRGGTRVNGEAIGSAWLLIGDVIEIAGREIELKEVELNGSPFAPPRCHDLLLDDADERILVGVTLEPKDYRGSSWAVGSELVFIGQGDSCGVRLSGGSTAKTHCALLRSSASAYVIDLLVQRTSVNNQPVHGSARLDDGAVLTIGQEEFIVHIEPFSGEHVAANLQFPGEAMPDDSPSTSLARVPVTLPSPIEGHHFPIANVPADAQNSAFNWMLGAIQASHGELIRRQNDLQMAMSQVLRQVQDDSAVVLNAHLERIEALNREITDLRKVVDAPSSASPEDSPNHDRQPALPVPARRSPDSIASSPHQMARGPDSPALFGPPTEAIPPCPLVGPPIPVSDRSRETTTWLLGKIDRIETENKFSLKNLFRFGRPRPVPNSPGHDQAQDQPAPLDNDEVQTEEPGSPS